MSEYSQEDQLIYTTSTNPTSMYFKKYMRLDLKTESSKPRDLKTEYTFLIFKTLRCPNS